MSADQTAPVVVPCCGKTHNGLLQIGKSHPLGGCSVLICAHCGELSLCDPGKQPRLLTEEEWCKIIAARNGEHMLGIQAEVKRLIAGRKKGVTK